MVVVLLLQLASIQGDLRLAAAGFLQSATHPLPFAQPASVAQATPCTKAGGPAICGQMDFCPLSKEYHNYG
jgi:hypothetical protein